MSQHCRANPCCGDRPCSGIPLPQDASGLTSHNVSRGISGTPALGEKLSHLKPAVATLSDSKTVSASEIIDFLYKHGDLTYSAAASAVNLLTGNGYTFIRSVITDAPAGASDIAALREELSAAASLLETLSEELPDDDVSGIMMKVMAERNRSALQHIAKGERG